MIRIINYIPGETEVIDRSEDKVDVASVVSEIINNVKKNGDAALREYAIRFDGGCPDCLEVSADEINAAYDSVEPELIAVMEEAAENIREFHRHQLRQGFEFKKSGGIVLGQKVLPIEKAGIYVPGGTASYPSTVLMDSIPAKIAGVGEIIMVSPPSKGGHIDKRILAAAKIAGIDRIFATGGAQAVAALAYGTESVPKVDKIVGPGNCFVAEAKRQVFGAVAIDMIAGPSEILVVADKTANPRHAAADLLSQAEHDKLASAVLVCDDEEFAKAVQAEVEIQLEALPRREIARESIDKRSRIIVVADTDEAIAIANELAPEHLELCVKDPFAALEKVRHAGSVFLGMSCPEALGDYFAGPNHTLPTGGSARFSSPLSVDDFVKRTAYTYYTPEALSAVANKIAMFAESEGLSAHARSVTVRKEEK